MSTTARPLAFLALLAAVACSGRGTTPSLVRAPLPMPSGISPASVPAPPMKTTAILPSSAMASRTPAAAIEPASWGQMSGVASQITVDKAGIIYALSDQPAGPDKYIWRNSGGTWTNLGGEASQLVITPAGAIYVINSAGGIYILSTNTWVPIAGGASSIAAASDGSLYAISNGGAGPDRSIWHYSAGAWTQVPGAGVAVVANPDLSYYGLAGGRVDPGGVYVVNSTGAIYYLNGTGSGGFAQGSYTLLPGSATTIAPTLYGAVFALGYPHNPSGDPIYDFDFTSQTWSTYPGLASSISYGADGHLYAVAPSGGIYVTSAIARPITSGVRIDTDPFSNSAGQHATEVEPSAAAHGTTIVSAFQAGRFASGGASGIDVATSFDAGQTWTAQPLPGITKAQNPGNIYTFGSDPVVAYDARRATWLVSSMAVVTTGATGPAFVVSHSRDGVSWDVPTYGPMVAGPDKPWIACDNTASSPHYGACYAGWENGYGDGSLDISISTDGAMTWSTPTQLATAGFSSGIVPVIRPDGRIVAPYLDESTSSIDAFSSSDGGATWSGPVTIGVTAQAYNNRAVRSFYAPTVTIDSAGTIYAAWEPNDTGNPILFSKSADGGSWSAPTLLPTGPDEGGTTARLIPAIAADPGSSGHLAVTYYLQVAACAAPHCTLSARLITSSDGGATWTTPSLLADPIYTDSLAQAASFVQGVNAGMLGDYEATVYSGGAFVSIFASASPKTYGVFDEAIYASTTSFATASLRSRSVVTVAPQPTVRRSAESFHRALPPD